MLCKRVFFKIVMVLGKLKFCLSIKLDKCALFLNGFNKCVIIFDELHVESRC